MKHILKNNRNEPPSLRLHRKTPGATFGSLHGDTKQEIRAALADEQGFLCAYCMRRIKADAKSMEVEHFVTQNWHPDSGFTPDEHRQHELLFGNMLGTCQGSRSCSGIRGNTPLTVDPRNRNCEHLIKFKKDGHAYSDNPKVERDIENLRMNELADNRREVIDKAREELINQFPNRTWDNALIDNEIARWKSRKTTRHGFAFEPYCMAAVHYLESKKS